MLHGAPARIGGGFVPFCGVPTRAARPGATSCNTFREVLHGTLAGIGWGFVPFCGGADTSGAPPCNIVQHFSRNVARRRRGAPGCPCVPCNVPVQRCGTRSEEHTSELQSLMRTSYSVFCFKKKNSFYTNNT